MTDCVFCAIAEGRAQADVVAEDDAWIAFRDLSPKAPSHVLVIPRRHIENIDGLAPDDAALGGALLLACREVARLEGLEGGYRVITNTRGDGGQVVPHLHLHVIGGRRLGWPPG